MTKGEAIFRKRASDPRIFGKGVGDLRAARRAKRAYVTPAAGIVASRKTGADGGARHAEKCVEMFARRSSWKRAPEGDPSTHRRRFSLHKITPFLGYGLSWQIVPTVLSELMKEADQARARRACDAMLKRVKIDSAALQAAANGET
ncbi:MAG: hypothetical protein ABI699_09530 [Caldimonas sp.]